MKEFIFNGKPYSSLTTGKIGSQMVRLILGGLVVFGGFFISDKYFAAGTSDKMAFMLFMVGLALFMYGCYYIVSGVSGVIDSLASHGKRVDSQFISNGFHLTKFTVAEFGVTVEGKMCDKDGVISGVNVIRNFSFEEVKRVLVTKDYVFVKLHADGFNDSWEDTASSVKFMAVNDFELALSEKYFTGFEREEFCSDMSIMGINVIRFDKTAEDKEKLLETEGRAALEGSVESDEASESKTEEKVENVIKEEVSEEDIATSELGEAETGFLVDETK